MKLFISLAAAPEKTTFNIIETLDQYIDGYHIDIMDGIFVPTKRWDFEICSEISKTTNKPLWIHAMIKQPEIALANTSLPPQSIISFHPEATQNWKQAIRVIQEKNCIPSIALTKYHTSYDYELISSIDHFVIMGVTPGASGQPFISNTYDRIIKLKQHILNKNNTIAADGGVSDKNIYKLAKLHVQEVAIGSAILQYQNTTDQITTIKKIRDAV